MKRRLIFITLCLTFILSFCLFAGCKNQDDSSGGEVNSPNSPDYSGSSDSSGEQNAEPEKYSEGLEFTLNADGVSYSVSKGTCTDTNVVIPAVYNEKPVTSIRDYAFTLCKSLTSITIPDTVTSIGPKSFDWCDNLQYNEYDNALYLGNKNNPYVALIKAKDTKITSCTINNKTKLIAYLAFIRCKDLTSIAIPDSVTSIDKSAFSSCGLTSITIPNSVTSIGWLAFDNCDNLQYNEYDNALYLGNDDNSYFALIKAKDTSITSCTFNDKTKIIAGTAFRDCFDLTSVTIGNSVTSIGDDAFFQCRDLTRVDYLGTIDQWVQIEFHNVYNANSNPLHSAHNLYIDNKLVTEANISTATSINNYAFEGCYSLTSVIIDNGVTSVGDWAFASCIDLTSINIPDSVTSIGDWAFEGCYSLTSITIGNSVTSIGGYAFYGCENLTEIKFNGTKEQWNAIEKVHGWNYKVLATKVICTDGEVAL